MFDDEDRKPAPGAATAFRPAPLDGWSAEALHEYIASLRNEILRAESALQSRAAQRQAAEGFFRPKPE